MASVVDMTLPSTDGRDVFFFDVDDCLYSQDLEVDSLVGELISEYISTNLGLSEADTRSLQEKYYKEYGLTVIGLQRFHKVDPLDFNRRVDDQLPMNKLLSRSIELFQFFASFDRSKVKLWLFTNAHITHALRVVGLLGIAHFFEGITYCDYGSEIGNWTCKPSLQMLEKAEREAGVRPETRCFYVDDSIKNCTAAAERGWQVLWIQNRGVRPGQTFSQAQLVTEKQPLTRIESLLQIRNIIPRLFVDRTTYHHRTPKEDGKQSIRVSTIPVGLCASA